MSRGICLLVPCLLAFSQSSRPPGEPVPGNLPVQRLGARDLISVTVYNAAELSRTVRVSAEGLIRLPMLDQPLEAAGRLPAELEASIAAALRKAELLVDPVVTVAVVEYVSRPISVMGAVRKPVTFQAAGPLKLLDALTRAEGLLPEAGADILVTRGGGSPHLVERVPVRRLIDAADPALNLTLEGGEEIRVPEAGKIFVVGNVRKPGAFAIPDDRESTVLQLLALSEGLLPFAAKQAYLYRAGSDGRKQEIPVELNKIMARKAPDLAVRANDILYVPDNAGRRAGMAALERILTFGSTTASGALIWGAAR